MSSSSVSSLGIFLHVLGISFHETVALVTQACILAAVGILDSKLLDIQGLHLGNVQWRIEETELLTAVKAAVRAGSLRVNIEG